MQEKVPNLVASQKIFISSKETILQQWVSYKTPKEILKLHKIDEAFFKNSYASGVFDYFMGVIANRVEIGNCPVMQSLLAYLKDREISADELFEICSHFRRSMVDFSYDAGLNSKELFDEISFIFDKNFRGILKFYTDTIFQKLIDARLTADRASQAKEYFLSNMSHEIRTPLNAILGFVNILIDENISKKHRAYLDIILSSGENLLSIINDILDFSKLRSGEFTIEPKLFSFHSEIEHTLELFVASATKKNITITAFIDPNIADKLYGDILRIKQILSNFLSNAIKFTLDGGHICVEALYEDNNLKISVIDSGIGIKKEDIKNIFTAFAQAQNSELKQCDGTGLGLSICHQLAQHMKGKVTVASTYKEGSAFGLEIPINMGKKVKPEYKIINDLDSYRLLFYSPKPLTNYKQNSLLKYKNIFNLNLQLKNSLDTKFDVTLFIDEEVDENFRKKIIKSDKKYLAIFNVIDDKYDNYEHIVSISFPLYATKLDRAFFELLHPSENLTYQHEINTKFRGHILVVEDNEANQELIKILLLKYGLSFEVATNGKEALELYKSNKYDLILMDEQMPVMDGNRAVQKILEYEEQHNLTHTPISALTANVIKGAKERGLNSGFDSFLSKPIVLKDLEIVLAQYLKVDANRVHKSTTQYSQSSVTGLDSKKLQKELMLNNDEFMMLLTLFIKKMKVQIPELQNAIKVRDYKKIALNAHSIKGSSGNFRIETLQKSASEMEQMAKEKNSDYNYESVCKKIKSRVEEIVIA